MLVYLFLSQFMEEIVANKMEIPNGQPRQHPTATPQKHTSMIYGLEFSCKVPLFRRHHSNLFNFEEMEKEAIFHKVHAFLTKLISSPSSQASLILSLQFNNMGLTISRSTSSISSTSSLSGGGGSSNKTSGDKTSSSHKSSNNKTLKGGSNKASDSPDKTVPLPHFTSLQSHMGKGERVSAMSKSNRISITNAIPQQSNPKIQCKININRLNTLIEQDAVESNGQLSANSLNDNDNGSLIIGSTSINAYQSKQSINSGLHIVKLKSRKQLQDKEKDKEKQREKENEKDQSNTNYNHNPTEQKQICIGQRNTSIVCCGQIDILSESLFGDSEEELPACTPTPTPTTPPLSITLIEAIYQTPAPFLINLSLCLLMKYLACGKVDLTQTNVGWIMSISTVVAYKIYYDQPIEGLISSMASILDITPQAIISLQRHFLKVISYQAVITNHQYHELLTQVIK